MGTLAIALIAGIVMTLGMIPRLTWAWGCEGHHVVALIAERHLENTGAATAALKLLSEHPIDPNLKRFCDATGLDVFADAATWADDYRDQVPETGDWHFLDIPRGAANQNIGQYCPPAGCVTTALRTQMEVLNNSGADAANRADALRFVIHFAGDIHQPLHITTNNDRGGNCVPVWFFGKKPVLKDPQKGSYTPNLHASWDTDLVQRTLKVTDAAALGKLATTLVAQFKAKEASWQSDGLDFDVWAWGSHQLAESQGYQTLPKKIPIETPQPVQSCNDANHVSARMLKLKERIGSSYAATTAPVIREQLAKAGFRLAQLLKSVNW